jgi:hypothetical protein
MGVGADAPKSREMLDGAGDARRLQAAQVGRGHVRRDGRVGRDRALVDQAVEVEPVARPPGFQVDHRRKVQRDSEA